MENLRNSFTKFCNITSDVLVINGGDSNTATAVKNSDFSGTIVTFGFDCENDYFPRNIQNREFDLMFRGDFLKHIKLSVPGEHNVLNALAACATAHHCGIGESSIAKGLESFTGAGRRFEILAEKGGITVADDYAHHPAEIEATLKAAKTMDFKRIWAIHQPFTYSRTKSMLNEFAASLSIADKVTLTEIMGGRESDTLGVKTEDLVELVNCKEGCNKLADFGQIADYVADNSESGDLIITLGCGDVNKIAKKIVESLYFSS
jgi:UDP-N-acetylmuramate--alanine ligase